MKSNRIDFDDDEAVLGQPPVLLIILKQKYTSIIF